MRLRGGKCNMFVISTKCGVAARMEKSISKARFLDVARNDISKKNLSAR